MAVQAQYPSNALYSDYPSRMPIGSVLEDIHAMQSRQIQNDRGLPVGKRAAGLPNASVFSDHPQSELTCNVSAYRKRSRDEQVALAAPAAAHPLIPRVSNPSFLAASFGLKAGSCGAVNSALLASREQSLQGFNLAVASTSGRPANLSSQPPPAAGSFGQEIISQICHHNLEMDAYIGMQYERIRLGVEETRKRHCKSLFSVLEQLVMKRFREKETELQDANRKNAELEEKIQQMSAESQAWFNVAKNNELLASNLKSNLEHLLYQNAAAAAVVPSSKEGYGDSDDTPLPVDDGQSFCFDVDARMPAAALAASLPSSANAEAIRQPLGCKVCGVDEASVLVLPCRHLCLCQACDSSVAMCPICNYPKNASLQVFM